MVPPEITYGMPILCLPAISQFYLRMTKKYRLCISAKDIASVLDLSPRQAQRKYQQAKDAYGKASHQHLTVHEFAAYYGLPIDDVIARL